MTTEIDRLHHQYLLGNKEAKDKLEDMLSVGIRENCPDAIRVSCQMVESIKRRQKRIDGLTPPEEAKPSESSYGFLKYLKYLIWSCILIIALIEALGIHHF